MSSPQRGKAGSISSPSGAKGGSTPSSPTGNKGGGAPSSPTGGKGALGSPSGVKSAQQTFQRVLPPPHARYQVVLLPSFIHQRYRLHTLSPSDLPIPRSLNRSVPPFPSSSPPSLLSLFHVLTAGAQNTSGPVRCDGRQAFAHMENIYIYMYATG